MADSLAGLTSAELEREANKLLYGAEKTPRKTPRRSKGEIYLRPKDRETKSGYVCVDCARPRSDDSAVRCRACYLKRASVKRPERQGIDADTYHNLTTGGFENGERVPVYHSEDITE